VRERRMCTNNLTCKSNRFWEKGPGGNGARRVEGYSSERFIKKKVGISSQREKRGEERKRVLHTNPGRREQL